MPVLDASCRLASVAVTTIGTDPARNPAPPMVPCVSPAGSGRAAWSTPARALASSSGRCALADRAGPPAIEYSASHPRLGVVAAARRRAAVDQRLQRVAFTASDARRSSASGDAVVVVHHVARVGAEVFEVEHPEGHVRHLGLQTSRVDGRAQMVLASVSSRYCIDPVESSEKMTSAWLTLVERLSVSLVGTAGTW